MQEFFDIEKQLSNPKSPSHCWSWFRMAVFEAFRNANSTGRRSSNKLPLKAKISRIFYGFFKWLKRPENLFFNQIVARHPINGQFEDVRFDQLVSLFDPQKSLMIEFSSEGHIKSHKLPNKNVCSRSLIEVLVKIRRLLPLPKISLDEIQYCQKASEAFGVNINVESTLQTHQAYLSIYTLLFKFYRPKRVFIDCSYANYPIVKAAKKLSIPVIEHQHGVISNSHPGYFYTFPPDKELLPDILLVNGESMVDLFAQNQAYNNCLIYPVGSRILSHYRQEASSSSTSFNCVVTLQRVVETEVVQMISEVAPQFPNIHFYLLPRRGEDFVASNYKLSTNISIEKNLTFYELCQKCQIHITGFSTCALEAPTLGLRNILINAKNKAKEYFKDNLSDQRTTLFVETAQEFASGLNYLQKGSISKKGVSDSNAHNYHPNNTEQLKIARKLILEREL